MLFVVVYKHSYTNIPEDRRSCEMWDDWPTDAKGDWWVLLCLWSSYVVLWSTKWWIILSRCLR